MWHNRNSTEQIKRHQCQKNLFLRPRNIKNKVYHEELREIKLVLRKLQMSVQTLFNELGNNMMQLISLPERQGLLLSANNFGV